MAELRWGAATDSGLVRDANEDAFVAEALVFGVADGMGGHRAGEVAAALASRTLRERLSGGAANIDVVVAAVLEANSAIFMASHGNAAQQGMGTTVTALAVLTGGDETPEKLALVNVGDSRTYLHRGGELTRATIDHSYVQELVATGHITEAEARTHPRRNIVTRALGIEATVRVDAWILPIVRGDRFILCSDGLVDEVPDHEIADVAGGIADPQRAADELVAMANRHGGRDNVTVIVVDVIEGLEPGAMAGLTAAVAAVDPDSTGEVAGPDANAVDDAAADGAGADDATAEMDAGLPEAGSVTGAAPRSGRRLTPRLFLLLLGIAAVVTLAITLIAVAVSNDGSPTPTKTVPDTGPDTSVATSTTETETTEAPTTEAPTTETPTTNADEPSTTADTETTTGTTTSPGATTAAASTAPQTTETP